VKRLVKVAVLLALLGGAGVAGYRYFTREELEKITVTSAALGAVEETVSATGSIQVNRTVLVTTEPGTRIVALHFREQDRVREGQLLARLDDADLLSQRRQLRASLELVEVNLASARLNRDRLSRLHEKGFVARQEVEAAERQVDQYRTQAEDQKASIALVEARLRRMSVLAPISGVVTRKFVEEGGTLTDVSGPRPPGAVAEISELEATQLHAEVDQADIARVKIGQKATVRLDALAGRTLGAVTREIGVGSTPDPTGRVRYRVKLRVDAPPGLLKVGMTGTASFILARKERTLTLPAPLILQQGEEEFVFVVEGGRARLRKVKIGLRGEEVFEIVSGLTASEAVVDQGRAKLKDRQRVEVLNAKR
jgi:RND family efflux transporter MFP subunit